MIYTLTLNPSIDYYIYCNDLKVGDINRANDDSFVAGGKGINVSRMLSILSIPSVCVFPDGGFSGNFLENELNRDELIKTKVVKIEEPNRINVKIRHQLETDINTLGPNISVQAQEELIKLFDDLKENDYLVLSGTVQSDLFDMVKKIARVVREKKAKLVLDVPNMTLCDIIECTPYLIKPNIDELRKMTNMDSDVDTIIESLRSQLESETITKMLVSMGKDGACYVDKSKKFRVIGPALKVVNTVAAGDSMLATLVGMLQKQVDEIEAVKYAVACGTACVASEYLPTVEFVNEVFKKVTIE